MLPSSPAAPPGLPGKPSLPGNLAGGPTGPGASPALAPGNGAGNEAAADALIQGILPAMHKALSAYPVGAKKYSAVLNALRALTANFGREQTQGLVPAAIMQMAQAAKTGGPMAGAPPPGIAPAPPPGGPPGGAEPPTPAMAA